MHKDGHEHNLRRLWSFLQCTVQLDGGICALSANTGAVTDEHHRGVNISNCQQIKCQNGRR